MVRSRGLWPNSLSTLFGPLSLSGSKGEHPPPVFLLNVTGLIYKLNTYGKTEAALALFKLDIELNTTLFPPSNWEHLPMTELPKTSTLVGSPSISKIKLWFIPELDRHSNTITGHSNMEEGTRRGKER